jgi:cytochrome c peroxidase
VAPNAHQDRRGSHNHGGVWAQQPSVTFSPAALKEIAEVEAEIDRIETQSLERLAAPPDNQVQQVELLGKAMLYDKRLSVNRNEACAFCHMPETGFTGFQLPTIPDAFEGYFWR